MVYVHVLLGWIVASFVFGVLFGCFASQRPLSDIWKKEDKNGAKRIKNFRR